MFSAITTVTALQPTDVSELHEDGFVVLPGPMSVPELDRVSHAYDEIVASASAEDVHAGNTTTRVNDFVNRGDEFDALYVFAPLLDACSRVIGRDFKLSSMHARTLRPHTPAQELHVDVRRDSPDWPLVGFILMIDAFHVGNGATRFVPGTHASATLPEAVMADRRVKWLRKSEQVG